MRSSLTAATKVYFFAIGGAEHDAVAWGFFGEPVHGGPELFIGGAEDFADDQFAVAECGCGREEIARRRRSDRCCWRPIDWIWRTP